MVSSERMVFSRHQPSLAVFTSLLAALAAGPALAAAASPASPASSPHVAFIEGRPFAEVLKKARAEKKMVLLDMVAAWCGPCKIMDKTTFADPAVAAWANKSVIAARFDAEKGEGRKLGYRYAIRSFPTVLFLDGKGNEVDRLLGAHPPEDFHRYGSEIVNGKSRFVEGLAKLDKQWSTDSAMSYVQSLAQRNDLERLRPVAIRIVNEDPDLTKAETLDSFALLVAIEDYNEKLSPETTDLLMTYLPRLGSEPRALMLSTVLARELARRGDVPEVRKLVAQAMEKAQGNLLAADLQTAQGNAEKRAGNHEAAIQSFRKAAELADKLGAGPGARAMRQLDLAEAYAAAGKKEEARAALTLGFGLVGESDVTVLTRAARIALLLKRSDEAVTYAKKAVTLSQGEDVEAQIVLARSLAASGDSSGAATAWKRAGELEPENVDVVKHQGENKKGATKTS